MLKSIKEIIDYFDDNFESYNYNDCYVGVTSDIKQRLFVDHNVSEQNGHFTYWKAPSSTMAREVEQYFLERGMDGASGGGDESAIMVYAYVKTPQTNP